MNEKEKPQKDAGQFLKGVRRKTRKHFTAGAELGLLGPVTVRGGYLSAGASPGGLGQGTGASAGVGLALGRLRVDYAFSPAGELGGAQRLALAFRW